MEREEIIGRVQGGWTLLGRQAVKTGKAIVTPGNPGGAALEDADIWMLDEPMIPQGMVATLIVQAMAQEDPLEYLSFEMYGMDLGALSRALEEATNAQKQHPSKD